MVELHLGFELHVRCIWVHYFYGTDAVKWGFLQRKRVVDHRYLNKINEGRRSFTVGSVLPMTSLHLFVTSCCSSKPMC